MNLSQEDIDKLDAATAVMQRIAQEHTGWGVALFVHCDGSVAVELIWHVIGQTSNRRTWLRDCEDGYDPIDKSPGEALQALVADPFRPFKCGFCPGIVDLCSAQGLVWDGGEVSASINVPRCNQCGEAYLRKEDVAALR